MGQDQIEMAWQNYCWAMNAQSEVQRYYLGRAVNCLNSARITCYMRQPKDVDQYVRLKELCYWMTYDLISQMKTL